jgi:uncharacterized membrane protein
MMNLEKYFKKYVWDEKRTPYFVPVVKMTRDQADYEVHAYALFIGILFGMVTVGSLLSQDPEVKSDAVAIYGLTVVCAAIVVGFTTHTRAALYCGAAPVVALLYLFLYGVHSNLSTIDHMVLIAFGLMWLRYSVRVLAIARAYPAMSDPSPET